ncbi:MAG: 50S ribosomal protein L6 [Nitrospirae bacterium]|nr:50S ribosomal protein L6 [Nitrospirota bacterium]
MSRIGKKPVEIPSGVDVAISQDTIEVKGPKGELKWVFPGRMKVKTAGRHIEVERSDDSKVDRALHGLTRSLISNMVTGVTEGYQKVLEITGVGYKAQVQGNKLLLSLGYSHPVEFEVPEGIKASVDQKQVQITLSGIDKYKIGQIAANIMALRPPDAYKGKGIRYKGQRIKLKAGKAGKTKGAVA